mgnify:CR=1 FL=1
MDLQLSHPWIIWIDQIRLLRIVNARYCHRKKRLVCDCAGMWLTRCEEKRVWSFNKLKGAWIALPRVLWNHPGVYSLFYSIFISARLMPNLSIRFVMCFGGSMVLFFCVAITPLLSKANSNKNVVLSYSPAMLSQHLNKMVKYIVSR